MLDQYIAPVFHSTSIPFHAAVWVPERGSRQAFSSLWQVLELDVSCLDVTRCDRGEVPLQKPRIACFDEGEGICIPPEIVKPPATQSAYPIISSLGSCSSATHSHSDALMSDCR